MGSLEQAQITGFLCRLCSKMHRAQYVIFIYGAEGTKYKLEHKINNYLPVTVSPTDLLPKTICQQCMTRVEQHHKLMETISANHKKFQKLQASQVITRRRIALLSSASSTSSSASTSNSSNVSTSTESLAVVVGSDTDSIPDDNSNNATNNDSTIGDDESLIESVNSE